jgi:fumarate hydratase, class II
MANYRIERDSLGEVRVPARAKYAAQTQRAVDNFPISGQRIPRPLIEALAWIKAEAARVNAQLDSVPQVTPRVGRAIAAAADEVAEGRWDAEFPVDVFQTGSGTSSNMNANEVIATLAGERLEAAVHPNDQVNASQSSNDVFPSAVQLAAAAAITRQLLPALAKLERALARKARELARVVKAGRTHLMDATPVTLGQELGGHAAQIEQASERIEAALPRLGELPLGGTATGTGLNAPEGFADGVIERLRKRTRLPLARARNAFAAQSARDALVDASAALRGLGVALFKIANDLRWMASGPRAGLAEIELPALQPGSSIMPGKVNPVIPEAVMQVVARVMGHDVTIAFAGTQGSFELNTFVPVMGHALLESIQLLTNASELLAERCVAGLTANAERCRRYAESSPALATALVPLVGYDVAAQVVHEAAARERTLREVLLERGLVAAPELERALDVDAMARGGVRVERKGSGRRARKT